MRLFWSYGVGALVVAILALGSGCGAAATGTSGTHAAVTHIRRPPPTPHSWHRATIHFAEGRQSAAVTMSEPDGVILLYRISAPVGARIRGTTQLPSITVPLVIGTFRVGPSSSCHVDASRVTCTVGEEWCPMPAGAWHLRLRKFAGPAGDVTVWFRLGQPPAKKAD